MRRLLAVLVLALAGNAWSQVLLSDSFGGGAIDSSKWDVYLPWALSSVSLQNGAMRSVNRGTIVTRQDFGFPYVFTGTFRHSSIYDVTTLYLRSSGQRETTDFYGGMTGIGISLWSSFHPTFGGGNIHITRSGISGSFATYTLGLNPNIDYSFWIRDTGDALSVRVTGSDISPIDWYVPIAFSAGSKIALASRENTIHTTQTGILDLLEVQVAVPEPSSLSLLLAGSAVLMAGRRRIRG